MPWKPISFSSYMIKKNHTLIAVNYLSDIYCNFCGILVIVFMISDQIEYWVYYIVFQEISTTTKMIFMFGSISEIQRSLANPMYHGCDLKLLPFNVIIFMR